MTTPRSTTTEGPFDLEDSFLSRPEGFLNQWSGFAGGTGWLEPWWYVEGRCTTGDRAGSSVSHPHRSSYGEANTERTRLMADPEESAKYDTWLVLECRPMLRTTVCDQRPGHHPAERGKPQ